MNIRIPYPKTNPQSTPKVIDQPFSPEEPVPFPCTTPRTAAPQPERPICTRTKRCEGCPYPAHGFICWSESGPCLRTLTERRRKTTQDNEVPTQSDTAPVKNEKETLTCEK